MLTAPLSEQSTEVSNESDILLPPSSTDAAANSRNAEDVIFPEQAVHGQHISWASAYILIVSRMMGSGVFASPGVVMQSAGSIGLSLCVWIFGAFMAGCGAAVSLEYGCMLPRSGGEKVYLEYVYRRPRFLMSTLIAVKTVLQTATVNNCIIFGEYFVYGLPIAPSVTARKLSAIGLLLCTGILHGLFLKTGILIQNTLGWLKICLMICLALTAMYVLAAGLVKGPGPPILLSAASDHESIWNVIWKGSRWSWDLVALALFRVYYAYAGLDNANMALNEVQDPVGMLRRVVPMALFSVTSLYLLINCAFFLVLPSETFKEQGEMAAVAFFVHVLGHRMGTIVFPLLIAFCVVGNVMVGMFSLVRTCLTFSTCEMLSLMTSRIVTIESGNSSAGFPSAGVRFLASGRDHCQLCTDSLVHPPPPFVQHIRLPS